MFLHVNMLLLTIGLLSITAGINHASGKPLYCYSGEQSIIMAWKCDQQAEKCVRVRASDRDNDAECLTSLNVCNVLCDADASLWPLPTGNISVEKDLLVFKRDAIIFSNFSDDRNKKLNNLLEGLQTYFLNVITSSSAKSSFQITRKNRVDSSVKIILADKQIVAMTTTSENNERYPTDRLVHHPSSSKREDTNTTVTLRILFEDRTTTALTYETSEAYSLRIDRDQNETVNVIIEAHNFFGARHGMETLLQLIVYDEISDSLLIPAHVRVTDEPAYKHRGVLLDTSRNYHPVDMITRLLDGMAYNKLNVFHWHMTDSHSFPYLSKSHPEMAMYGAYGPFQVYTTSDINYLVEYARLRGIKIMPELDTPIHVGEGWQYFEEDVLLCFKKEPWSKFCDEPPCGVLNPINDRVYQILGDLYAEWNELFDSDVFHMGGDEVRFVCWNETESIVEWLSARNRSRDEDSFLDLWAMFLKQSVSKFDDTVKVDKKPRIVLWTSDLTKSKRVKNFLDLRRYIVQIWCGGKDKQIIDILNDGYDVIFSNFDALYLDSGFGSWIGDCNNSCDTYRRWQTVYMNDPIRLVQNLVNKSNPITAADYRSQILGLEVTVWSEKSDDRTMSTRMWPRAAAHAERAWTNPSAGWQKALSRFARQRERMIGRNIDADVIQPLWCHQNNGHCDP